MANGTAAARVAGALAVALAMVAPTAARADVCGQLPVLLIVQDRSGSMDADPAGNTCTASGCTKWDISTQVVPSTVSSYSNRFDFGLMMFPDPGSSDVCSAGTSVLGVGASSSDVSWAYGYEYPGGATPTATSLTAAKAYLDSLNLTVPAYILLITDGMPNCNGNLNGSTCTCTASTYGCNPSNGGTAYNCLDDSRTETRAAAAYAAGYPVFVVGFGAGTTSGNNKAVLDAIASNGGTSHAYSATDQASLQSALDQVMGSVTTCCTDACALGDSQCVGNSAQSCQVGADGCTTWVTQTCGSGSTCSGGSCQSCSGTCTPGATTCGFFGDLQTCVADASGCTSWTSSFCAAGTTCSGGACQSCTTECTAGQTRCVGNGYEVCESDWQGCTSWSSTQTCGYAEICVASSGSCQSCNSACAAGTQLCDNSGTARTCVADANGCTAWQVETCAPGTTCSGGTCNACNACNPGETRCAGATPQTCVADSNGCSAWQDGAPCGAAAACVSGACVDCSAACSLGATQCSGNTVQTCTPNPAGGCNVWTDTHPCAAAEICVAGGSCCANACNPGETRCDASGNLQTCVAQPGACADWQTNACASGTVCSQGACLTSCTLNTEFNTCDAGYRCVRDPASGQGLCQPASTTSTSSGSGSGSGSTGASGSASAGTSAGTTTGTNAGSTAGTNAGTTTGTNAGTNGAAGGSGSGAAGGTSGGASASGGTSGGASTGSTGTTADTTGSPVTTSGDTAGSDGAAAGTSAGKVKRGTSAGGCNSLPGDAGLALPLVLGALAFRLGRRRGGLRA